MAELTTSGLSPREPSLGRRDLLRWLYLGRLTLVTGIMAGAIYWWLNIRPESTLIATVVFLVAVVVTTASFWYTHVLGREPGENFMYAQVILDVALVTAIVHVTQGPESDFAPVYILVISAGALLLPLPGGLLIGGLASIAYLADLAWGFQSTFTWEVALQIGLFTFVALVTGLLGDRLRHTGLALGEVASELHRLRLDTGDILANLATGVLTVDGGGRLAYANSAAARLLGLDRGELLGQPVLEELEALAPGLGGVLKDAIHEGRSVERFRTTVSGPPRVRLGVSTTVLERSAGHPNSATAIFQDITDLERIDELNLRTERLEAVAALSASLAHEIKNPLASIRSSVEQLGGRRLASQDREDLERLVLTESDRLSRLLSEFLDFSVLRLGLAEEIDVAALVADCVAFVKQHPDLQDVTVEIEPNEGDGPVRVIGDADLLNQALFNLLLNGAQSAGPGGRVVISIADQWDYDRPHGTDIEHPVRLTIRDNGAGVDPEQASRIFDPFFTTKKSGSGLGLAVVHRAVEAHHGATFLERAPEGGAQFVIFLPGLPVRSTSSVL